jgi:hypothetical protein
MVGLPSRLLALRIPLHCGHRAPSVSVPQLEATTRAVTGQTRKSGEWFHLADTNRFAASEIDKLPG